MSETQQQIKQHMEEIIEEHRDHRTNEVSPTRLAEFACDSFNDYEGENLDIPELYSELAVEVVEADARSRRAYQFFAEKLIKYESNGDVLFA